MKSLTLAWTWKLTASGGSSSNLRGTPLMIDGVTYLSTEDKPWRWTHAPAGKSGITSGLAVVAATTATKAWRMSGNFLYMETGDCHLLSLNREDGKLRWSKSICDLDQFYFASVAPVVVGNHVIAGVSGDDSDVGGYLESHDPETGELQWRFYTVPQKKGDPGSETWPNEDMSSHGGGMTWVPITYDPELKMIMSPPAIRSL